MRLMQALDRVINEFIHYYLYQALPPQHYLVFLCLDGLGVTVSEFCFVK